MASNATTRLAKLSQQIEVEQQRYKAAVSQLVLAALEENDLTLEDLKATNGAAKPKKAATKKAVKKPVAKKKKPLPPKYQDPETGATWSGHARPPSWIANVKNRDDYLIAQE